MSRLSTTDLEEVAKFIDGLTTLSVNTGVTVFSVVGFAQVQVGGEDVGLSLVDDDFENSGYQVGTND